MVKEIKLPEVGENVESGEIAKLLVSVGNVVDLEQPVLEFETDKAVVDVPSPYTGKITEIFVAVGDRVKIGDLLMKVETENMKSPVPVTEEEAVIPLTKAVEEFPAPEAGETLPGTEVVAAEKPQVSAAPEILREVAPASPSVRRFARELGVEIDYVSGSGPGGRITLDDVKAFTKLLVSGEKKPAGSGLFFETLPEFSRFGEIDTQPMSTVRKKTAEHLSYAWATIPHVTQFDKADITDLEKMRKQYSAAVENAGGKLTMTAILLKIVAAALKLFPQFNASVDMERKRIIFKKYFNIGVAVDTGRGLLVPVIRQVDRKNIRELSIELTALAEKARNRKLSPDDLQGGNFSVSNLGGIGGTYFTPVVNAPEVAVLGVSRSSMQPVYNDGQFQPKLMLPLSLSYDHRIIDGADAVRFLRWVVEALEKPFLILLAG